MDAFWKSLEAVKLWEQVYVALELSITQVSLECSSGEVHLPLRQGA